MGSATIHEIPKIDFSGLDQKNPGTQGWDTVRCQVFKALESLGCFEALYDGVSSELRDQLFGTAMEELFSLPVETKMQNTSSNPRQGYLGQIPGWAFESLSIGEAQLLERAQAFTNLMWPEGNPSFCNTVWTYAAKLQELEQMVRRMVLESLDVVKPLDSYIDSTSSGLRLLEYGVMPDQQTGNGMPPHKDMNVITILCQHQVEGLEMQTRSGEWIHVVPSPNSFTLLIGEAFQAWTNGRLQPPYHRVIIPSNAKRYSVSFAVLPRDGYSVQAPEELVDEDHPQLYQSYDYADYMRFRFSEAGEKSENALKTYCGVEGHKIEA